MIVNILRKERFKCITIGELKYKIEKVQISNKHNEGKQLLHGQIDVTSHIV